MPYSQSPLGLIAPPPNAKSAISKSQCHNKQQANSTTPHSNDNTDHSVTDSLPMYASNSVHHVPTDISPTSDKIY